MVSGTIFDIKKFSVHDGPGIRTTVFLKGCPLKCRWCHNPESQAAGPEMIFRAGRCIQCRACLPVCPQNAIFMNGGGAVTNRELCTRCGLCVDACYAEAREQIGREMPAAQVMAEILRDVPFYDESGGGVTFSGGEPLSQPRFLTALLRACKANEIHTALDTSGYAPWAVIDGLRRDVDLFLYDLKAMDFRLHRRLTGVSNGRILKNVQKLAERGHKIIIRVAVIPGVNDHVDNLIATAAFVANLPGVNRVDLLPYHNLAVDKYHRLDKPYSLAHTGVPQPDQLAGPAQIFEDFKLNVKIGG